MAAGAGKNGQKGADATAIGTVPEVASSSVSPVDVQEYIADMLRELQQMASASGQRGLSALIDLACAEAQRRAGRSDKKSG